MTPFPFAYLDPGSGSLLVQLLLGGSAALLVLARMGWHSLRSMLGAARPEGTTPEPLPRSEP